MGLDHIDLSRNIIFIVLKHSRCTTNKIFTAAVKRLTLQRESASATEENRQEPQEILPLGCFAL